MWCVYAQTICVQALVAVVADINNKNIHFDCSDSMVALKYLQRLQHTITDASMRSGQSVLLSHDMYYNPLTLLRHN